MPNALFYVKKFAVRRGADIEMYILCIPKAAYDTDPVGATKIADAVDNTRERGTPEQLLAVVDNLLKHVPQFIRRADRP